MNPVHCSQAVAAIRRLASGCADFHPSLLPSICQAASKAQHPAVGKEAYAAAVQALIKPEAAGSKLPAGQEALLLRLYVQAIASCLDAANAGPAASSDGGSRALYSELIAALKLVAKRIKLLGWAKFVGPDVQVRGGHVLLLVPTQRGLGWMAGGQRPFSSINCALISVKQFLFVNAAG